MRFLYRVLSIFALFASTKGGVGGVVRNRARRAGIRTLTRSMRKWGL